MKRLFTFGCSYTKYIWPTWSDFLSLEYDYYENWGLPGIGCRGIAERIAECHIQNNFNENDTIIVQWTTHLRHDFHHTTPAIKRAPGWQTAGSVFAPFNQQLYNDTWIKTFFNESSYIMHCLNNITLAQGLLKSTDAKWYMTSIGDWPKLSSDLIQDESKFEKLSTEEESLWTTFNCFNNYKKIWDNHEDHWIEGIETFLNKKSSTRWAFKEGKKPWEEDPHPSPNAYCLWLNERLRPRIGLTNSIEETQNGWLNELNEMKDKKPDREYLENKFRFRIDLDHWPKGVDTKFLGL